MTAVERHSPQNTPASARLRGSSTSATIFSPITGGDLCGKDLTPSAISDEPRIHTGSQLKGKGEEARRAREEATEEATQARIARGENPAEGGPNREHDHIDGIPGDNNRGDKGFVGCRLF